MKKKIIKKIPIKKKDTLTLKQELFCQMYVLADKEFFGNGVESYMEAYGDEVDKSKPNWYKSAQASASRLLSNVMICARINELLESGGLNDEFVDKQLLFLVTQHDDKNAKIQAIREFNKLRQRITEKMDMTSKGKPIPFTVISYKDYKKKNE